MYTLYAEGLRFFFAGDFFAFGDRGVDGLEAFPCCKAALIIRPNSSSDNDKLNHLSYRQLLIGLQLP